MYFLYFVLNSWTKMICHVFNNKLQKSAFYYFNFILDILYKFEIEDPGNLYPQSNTVGLKSNNWNFSCKNNHLIKHKQKKNSYLSNFLQS